MTEAESIVNFTLLWAVSEDSGDPQALSPFMLLPQRGNVDPHNTGKEDKGEYINMDLTDGTKSTTCPISSGTNGDKGIYIP